MAQYITYCCICSLFLQTTYKHYCLFFCFFAIVIVNKDEYKINTYSLIIVITVVSVNILKLIIVELVIVKCENYASVKQMFLVMFIQYIYPACSIQKGTL